MKIAFASSKSLLMKIYGRIMIPKGWAANWISSCWLYFTSGITDQISNDQTLLDKRIALLSLPSCLEIALIKVYFLLLVFSGLSSCIEKKRRLELNRLDMKSLSWETFLHSELLGHVKYQFLVGFWTIHTYRNVPPHVAIKANDLWLALRFSVAAPRD
jgi:hypothetical protein